MQASTRRLICCFVAAASVPVLLWNCRAQPARGTNEPPAKSSTANGRASVFPFQQMLRHPAALSDADRGIGLVHFNREPGSDERFREEAVIYEMPTHTSKTRAEFSLENLDRTLWSYSIVGSKGSFEPLIIEYGPQVGGLIFDSIDSQGVWLRVSYGRTPGRRKLTGWLQANANQMSYVFWEKPR